MEAEATAKRLRRGRGSSTCTRVTSMWIPAILGKTDSQANVQSLLPGTAEGKCLSGKNLGPQMATQLTIWQAPHLALYVCFHFFLQVYEAGVLCDLVYR